MDAPGRRVHEAQVSVDVGRFELRPFAVCLHQLEQRHQFRAMLRAPFRKHHQRLIVGGLGIFLRRFQNRQAEVFEQVVLECLRSSVRANVHVADHGVDLGL